MRQKVKKPLGAAQDLLNVEDDRQSKTALLRGWAGGRRLKLGAWLKTQQTSYNCSLVAVKSEFNAFTWTP